VTDYADETGKAGPVSFLAGAIDHLRGLLAYGLIAALVFGETAVFLGFVLPGEAAVVLGGVLASRGHISLWLLTLTVVLAACIGPFVGYEIGRRMGERVFASRALRRVPGGVQRVQDVLRDRGAVAVLLGRFIAVIRALMPAAAGAAHVRYRTFVVYNIVGGIVWGVGYSLLGYLAGSAYAVVERRVGTGLAIAIGVVVVILVAAWAYRRHRRARQPLPDGPQGPDERDEPDGPDGPEEPHQPAGTDEPNEPVEEAEEAEAGRGPADPKV
jgi:membrane-associated protein